MTSAAIPVPPLSTGTATPQTALRRAFWVVVGALAISVALTASPQYPESGIGCALIMAASLLPSWMWITGKVKGLPLFPIYALTHLWTFGTPLAYEHPIVTLFPASNQIIAAVSVTGFLLVGTFVWFLVGRRPVRPISRCLLMNARRADILFLFTLAGGTLLTVATTGNWFVLSEGVYPIVRAITLALEALACFMLGFRSGSGQLTVAKNITFKVLLVALLIASLPSLLLINAMSIAGVAALGFTVGARRFPWKVGIVAVCIFGFLHLGKSAMRERYWVKDEDFVMQPSEYPELISDWVKISAANVTGSAVQEDEAGQSLLERASLMQLLLYVQLLTPDSVPYMNGETYAILPSLLVPRIFNAQKVASHEGTFLLNIHYGFQTREATETTTVGFGLLNEAFANFGFIGIAGLAVVMGGFYGIVGRLARTAPILS
ncbi:MAG: hypothetical protein H0U43_05510, partial [Chthoniobacterales bacterium]|nr:hypothetical protein [Chthoniobacterales bacterium]